MTSTTWIIGGLESEKVAIGASVRQGVADWGDGSVEALVDNRGMRPVVISARGYPLTSTDFGATSRLQAALDLAI